MIRRHTVKHHELDRQGLITVETFKETVYFLGIKIKTNTHSYDCKGDKRKNAVGFQKPIEHEL